MDISWDVQGISEKLISVVMNSILEKLILIEMCKVFHKSLYHFVIKNLINSLSNNLEIFFTEYGETTQNSTFNVICFF